MEVLIPIIVILARLIIPFSIFRWPLWGAVAAMLADGADIMIFEKFGIGMIGWERYHLLDKVLDLYYVFILLLEGLKWENVFDRRVILGLFLLRFFGVVVFEITQWRGTFLFTPNIFENFYLGVSALSRYLPSFRLTPLRLLGILIIVSFPKLVQEYIMHYLEFPTWRWIRDHLFFWLYR